MTNATPTVNALAQLFGNTSPQVILELEKFFALAVAEITGGVNADMDTLAEVRTAVNLKAPIASPTFTGTVAGITKAMVGLTNVDNTSDANKPVSSLTQSALDAKTSIDQTFTALGEITGTVVITDAQAKTGLITCTLTGNTTFTMPSPAATAFRTVLVQVTQGGTGTYTLTVTGAKYAGGTAHDLTDAAASIDLLRFIWNGTHWLGSTVGLALAAPA